MLVSENTLPNSPAHLLAYVLQVVVYAHEVERHDRVKKITQQSRLNEENIFLLVVGGDFTR